MSRERRIEDQERLILIIVRMENQQNNPYGSIGNTDHHDPPAHWDSTVKKAWHLARQQPNPPPTAEVLEWWNATQQENQARINEAEARCRRQEEELRTLRQQGNGATNPLTPTTGPATQQASTTDTTALDQEVVTQPETIKPYLKSSDIRKPPKYGGQVVNDAARRWLQSVEEYFEAERTLAGKSPSEVQRIYYTKDFLDGTARTMWRAREERVRDNQEQPISTWTGFREWIMNNFKELLSEDKKWERFISCTQGNASVANYSSRFSNLAAQIKPTLPEHLVVRYFKMGAKPALQARLARDLDPPAKFEDLVRRFSQYEQGNAIAGHYMSTPQTNVNDPDAMDLSALAARPDRPKKGSPEWRAWCAARKACFTCGTEGHTRFACPNKGSGRGARTSGSGKE